MFNETYGNVTIKIEGMPKRGACLHISKPDGAYILADFCGMDPTLVADGTNAYFFGNKLILVTRWSDMTDEEKYTVEHSELILAIHPYKCVQFSIKIGDNWGDVMTTLHNFSKCHNDAEAPVDEIIFVLSIYLPPRALFIWFSTRFLSADHMGESKSRLAPSPVMR